MPEALLTQNSPEKASSPESGLDSPPPIKYVDAQGHERSPTGLEKSIDHALERVGLAEDSAARVNSGTLRIHTTGRTSHPIRIERKISDDGVFLEASIVRIRKRHKESAHIDDNSGTFFVDGSGNISSPGRNFRRFGKFDKPLPAPRLKVIREMSSLALSYPQNAKKSHRREVAICSVIARSISPRARILLSKVNFPRPKQLATEQE